MAKLSGWASVATALVLAVGVGFQDESKPVKTPDRAVPAALPAWLAGDFRGDVGTKGTSVHEHWEPPRAGRMLGLSHLRRNERSLHREFAQIRREGKSLVLEMRHGLEDEAPFYRYVLRSAGEARLVFENAAYRGERAFRIAYSREAEGGLRVEVSHRGEEKKVKTSVFRLRPATAK